jgi:DNA-binding Lrp family transcriptional regulator
VDQAIVAQLTHDGRMTNLELGRRVGVSEKTVRLRVRRLIDQAGLRISATLPGETPASRAVFMVNAKPGQRFALADALAVLPGVEQVLLTTGACDLMVHAAFASDSAALEFFEKHVEASPLVESATSSHVISSVDSRHRADGAFSDVAARVLEIDDVDALLDLACEVAASALGADRALAATLGPDTSPADPLARLRWRGLSSRYVEARARFGGPLSAVLLEQGQHLFVSDALTDPAFKELADLAKAEGYRSVLAVPIHWDDAVRAVLMLYYDSVIPWNEDLVSRTHQLADLIGQRLADLTEPPTARQLPGGRRSA